MNRHGISLNPTTEESRRLRELWRADDDRARVNRTRSEAERWKVRAVRAEAALRRAGLSVEEGE